MAQHQLTKLPYKLNGTIYRSPLPYSPLFDPAGELLNDFTEAGVDVVVMLTTLAEVLEVTGQDLMRAYQIRGFDVIHAPVEDFSIPDPGAFHRPIREALHAAQAGKTVLIHCHAGIGRTGMFAACLAKIVLGMTGEEAVAWVRQYVPDAVQTAQQFRYVENFVYPAEDA